MERTSSPLLDSIDLAFQAFQLPIQLLTDAPIEPANLLAVIVKERNSKNTGNVFSLSSNVTETSA